MSNFPTMPSVNTRGEIVLLEQIKNHLDRMEHDSKRSTAAAVAAGMIAATGRAHSPKEAAALVDDVYWALYPDNRQGRYRAWETEGAGDKAHT